MKNRIIIMMVCAAAWMAGARQADAQYQFGYLSYAQALQSMPQYAKAQTALDALKKKYEEEAQYNETKFKKMFADYLEGQKNFPEQIMLKRQKELQIAMEQGISFRKDAQAMLQKAEGELIEPLRQKLDSVLHLIGTENGLSFIANTDGNAMPFVHQQAGKDLSAIVQARLEGRIIPLSNPIVPAPQPEATLSGQPADAAAQQPAAATEQSPVGVPNP